METISIKARVRKEDIAYIDGLFESYETLAVVRTIDPEEAVIELLVSPSFISETKDLLEALKEEIDLEIL